MSKAPRNDNDVLPLIRWINAKRGSQTSEMIYRTMIDNGSTSHLVLEAFWLRNDAGRCQKPHSKRRVMKGESAVWGGCEVQNGRMSIQGGNIVRSMTDSLAEEGEACGRETTDNGL